MLACACERQPAPAGETRLPPAPAKPAGPPASSASVEEPCEPTQCAAIAEVNDDPGATLQLTGKLSPPPGVASFDGAVEFDESGTRLAVGAGEVVLLYSRRDGWELDSRLSIQPRIETHASFGRVIDFADGDELMAVGAPGDPASTGAVYFFRRHSDQSWKQDARLAGDTDNGGFGNALDLDAEGRTLAVAAYARLVERGDSLSEGMIFAFRHQASGDWRQVAEFTGLEGNDEFGDLSPFGVDLKLSANGRLLAVCERQFQGVDNAPMSKASKLESGALHIFSSSDDSEWDREIVLTAPRTTGNTAFCSQLTMDAAGSLIAVGASGDDRKFQDAGAVHMFGRVNGNWELTETLFAPTPVAGQRFGISTILSADGSLLLVGASATKDSAGDRARGEVFVFQKQGAGHWKPVAHVRLATGTRTGILTAGPLAPDYRTLLAFIDGQNGRFRMFGFEQGLPGLNPR